MNPTNILGALAGGVAGALVWAAVSYFLKVEVGYIAWGIGLLVGFASSVLGGRGTNNGILCAVIAIGSIVAGKFMAERFYVDYNWDELEKMNADAHEDHMAAAEAFAKIKGDEKAYPAFMIEYEYTEAEVESKITEEELTYFKSEEAPILDEVRGMPFSQWKEDWGLTMSASKNSTVLANVKKNIGAIDIIFALLGVVTAFKLGSGRRVEAQR